MNAHLPLISLAIPAYNESANLDELSDRLLTVFDGLKERYEFEVVICENGSSDNTYEKLLAIRNRDSRFKIIRLIRNFHMEGGMTAAIANVKGDACIIMSADLQDPPEMIPQLIEKWEEGYENVYTVITYRHGESYARRVAAQAFYWLIGKVSDHPIPRNASDFRLVSKAAYQAFNQLSERSRMVRSMWGWLGFSSTGIKYERPKRTGGKSSFNPFVTAPYAIRGILGSSYTPLILLPILGLILSLLSFAGLGAITIRAIFFGVPFPGFGTIVALMLLLFGFLFLLLGVLGEYIGMIFEESRARPHYLTQRSHGLDDK
jgi:polyisoprenyl-phosphate glycosyltransferase